MPEINQGKPQNDATEKQIRTRSTFDLSYIFFQTMRFGEYTPHFVEEGVDSDNLPLRSSHKLMSYTLKTPMLSDLKIHKDYFHVPMQAILPLNWSKWYKNPSIGQDVPNDCGPSVDGFWNKLGKLFKNSYAYITAQMSATPGPTASQFLDMVMKFAVFFERVYSDGSLMANLGIHGNQFIKIIGNGPGTSPTVYDSVKGKDYSYDEFFDDLVNTMLFQSSVPSVGYFSAYNPSSGLQYYVEINSRPSNPAVPVISVRDYLELLRDDFTWTINQADAVNGNSLVNGVFFSQWTALIARYTVTVFDDTTGNPLVPCDLRRMWAYQLVCFHYFTNDKVDFVYSADLFRQYVRQVSTGRAASGFDTVPYFSVNGLNYEYDSLSAYCFNRVVGKFSSTDGIFVSGPSSSQYPDSLIECYAYFRALLGFNRSLRYKDYFTGSRTRPLAVTNPLFNTDVQVNSNLVNVIDVTRGIQAQRFYNAINRIPQQIEDYLEGLFGKRPAPDYHNPFWLASTTDNVFPEESEYTGNVQNAEQNNITSVFRSNADRYAFEFSPDRDTVVIGVTYFDLPRAYGKTIERQALHLTRYDGFNPFMQFIGDQDVKRGELGVDASTALSPFGYQLRHMEYKQRYNQVAGAFRRFLPGYVFLADEDPVFGHPANGMIDPDYIRSRNTELDRFYTQITGYSLGSYFHFIIKNSNSQDASRPMAYAPSIL